MLPTIVGPYNPTGYQMIHSIDIRNFRCFEHLEVPKCRRINLIVGDNGSGKTALLEAIFMALAVGPEVALRYRQQRGLDGTFSGPPRQIEEALWRDLFFKGEWDRTISVQISGEGPESRSVTVTRGERQLFIPLTGTNEARDVSGAPISFTWRDHKGQEHPSFPRVSAAGIQLEPGAEDMPNFFYYAANQTNPSTENATRFSELSRSGRLHEFVRVFAREYKWIDDLSIEVLAGAPVIYATIGQNRLPLAYVSSGLNRIIAIMLAIASREQSVILVDEVEDGIYYKHHTAIWRGLISFARNYDSQIILTTHSAEWMNALAEAAGDDMKDISLWRLERSAFQPVLRQFFGKQVIAGIKAGEIR
jgi:predicted ATPase